LQWLPRSIVALAAVFGILLIALIVIDPHARSVALRGSGAFVTDGEFPSLNVANISGLRYGSWNHDDKNTGVLESEPFAVRRIVEITISGFPSRPEMSLQLVQADGTAAFDLSPAVDPRASWTRYTYRMPKELVGKLVRLRAVDGSRGLDGWMGIADLFTMDTGTWFYRHFAWKALALIALALTVILAVAAPSFSRCDALWMRRLGSPILYFVSLFLTLGVFRLPFILSGNLFNADEAQMTAQAITFLHHPIPWRDYDGTTSGPLNTWIVALPGLFGITPNLASSRIVTVACVSGTIFCLYLFFRASMPDVIARTAILVPFALFCLATDWAYIGYTSETLPMLLVASILAMATLRDGPSGPRWWIDVAIGILIGSLVFAKLQAAPIALFLFAALAITWRMKSPPKLFVRRLFLLASGIAVLPALIVIVTAATGSFRDFWLTYVVFPRIYVSGNCCNYAGPEFFFGDSAFRTYFQLSAILTVGAAGAAIAIAYLKRVRIDPRLVSLFGFFLLMSAVAVYAIEAPQTPFFHYLQWLVVPVGGVFGAALGGLVSVLTQTRKTQLISVCVAVVTLAAAVPVIGAVVADKSRSEQLSFRFGELTDPNAATLRRFIEPRRSVAIWGWMPQYLVYTRSIMGTRDAISQFQIEARALRPYYRERYLADVQRNRPDFVLEAIGASDFAFHDEASEGIGSFPPLAAYVRQNYELAFTSDAIRLYKRMPSVSP
jgi:hypothetical protein